MLGVPAHRNDGRQPRRLIDAVENLPHWRGLGNERDDSHNVR
jgi:hypothetical protein